MIGLIKNAPIWITITIISIIAYKASREDGLKNILAFIVTAIFKFILLLCILYALNSLEDYGCFIDHDINNISFIAACSFVIILLLFKNSLYQKLKFIFFKRTLLLAVIIYIIAISNAFYQSSNQIKQLRDDAFYNDLNITYEYNALLTSLTPRVKISLDKTYGSSGSSGLKKAYKIAIKLFDLPFNSRIEYYFQAYNSDTGIYDGEYDKTGYACIYNQDEVQFITILQSVLWTYLWIFILHFLIAKKVVFKTEMPFVGFKLTEIKKHMLVFWFVILFIIFTITIMFNASSMGFDRAKYGYVNRIQNTMKSSRGMIDYHYYKNINLTKGEKDGL